MRKLTVFCFNNDVFSLPVKNTFAKDAAIPLTFSGYVVTQGTANFGDNGGDNANNYYTFSDDESTFTPSAQLGVANEFFVIDALFGFNG